MRALRGADGEPSESHRTGLYSSIPDSNAFPNRCRRAGVRYSRLAIESDANP